MKTINPLKHVKLNQLAKNTYPLTNPTISLKPASSADANLVLQLLTADICKNLDISPITTHQEALQFVQGQSLDHHQRFSIWHSQQGMIGHVSFRSENIQKQRHANISYWVGEPYQRRGYAKQALNLLLKNLNQQGVNKVSAQVYRYNTASQHLLITLGFQCLYADHDDSSHQAMAILDFEMSLSSSSR